MAHIEFKNVSKKFGETTIISNFDASVEDGEFLVLLGPSGCGKSTLLRMIAGLTNVTSGDLAFDGISANEMSPKERGVAFVFQSYALYPHMTVRSNIAFPLVMDLFRKWHHIPFVNLIHRYRSMRRPEVVETVDRVARQLELEPLLNRRPANLSGGQRQRVALARSLVRDPTLYLLDEPLSNLDAKLRTQMRSEITTLHQRVKKTFIYVTHDQVEAMTMATRIVVMNHGDIQQIDTPDRIYDAPANTFVARFVGAPPMNLVPVRISNGQITADRKTSWQHAGNHPNVHEAILGVRPEKLKLEISDGGHIPAKVATVERMGAETIVGCRIGLDQAADDPLLLGTDLVFVRVSGTPGLRPEDFCSLSYDPHDIVWFDAETGVRNN